MIEELAWETGLEVWPVTPEFVAQLARQRLAQRRMSGHKAFTYVWEGESTELPCQQPIVKGPYRAGSLKLLNNLRYPFLIHRMEEATALPGSRRGTFRWRGLARTSGAVGPSYYLIGESVGSHGGMRVRNDSTRVDPDCQVIERGTLVRRVSEIEKVVEGNTWVRSPELKEALAVASLQHLYFRFLLGIGDSGTHNILVSQGGGTDGPVIAGIDFDEQRFAGEPRTALGCLFRKEYSYLPSVYGEFLSKVVLLERIDAHLGEALAASNEGCRRWWASLPLVRQRQLSPDVKIRPETILAANERFRRLLGRSR